MKSKNIISLKFIFLIFMIIFCFITINTKEEKKGVSNLIKLNQNIDIEVSIKNIEIKEKEQEISYFETNDNLNQQQENNLEIENKKHQNITQDEIISNITFGEQYANLIIEKIGVNAPIFYGANDNIILKGIGHEEESYFPNQNGSIILCGHNYMNNFNRFDELVVGDIIKIETRYGTFSYQLYDAQIVFETERDKAPIQNEEEILMIYTCYPLRNNGYTQYRYILFAKKV